MKEYETIRTETWQMMIPPDWKDQGETEEGALYFESTDQTNGFYIAVWHLPSSDHQGNADAVLESFRQSEMESFTEMEQCRWSFREQSTASDGTVRIALLDAYDPALNYRIVAKLIVALPLVVRASFHDYACEDYDHSRQILAPIIQSLKVHDES